MATGVLTRLMRVLVLAIVCSLIAAARLSADPVVVTSGLFVVAWDDPTFFNLIGDRFQLSSSFIRGERMASSPQQTCFSGCVSGTVVDMSAVTGSSSAPFVLGLGHAGVNGTTFREPVGLAGTLRFDAPPIVLPSLQPDSFGLKLTVPFVFSGEVNGFATDTKVQLFHLDLAGQGTATFLGDVANGVFTQPEARYNFAATPEPSTMLLLATGVAGMFRWRSRCGRGRGF